MSDPGFTVYRGLVRALSAGPTGVHWDTGPGEAVFFTDGSYRYGLPPRGLPSAPDRAEIPSRWGTWTEADGVVEVTRGGVVESHLARTNDALVDTDHGVEWTTVTGFPAGTRLDGSFARADFRDPGAPRIALSSDGRFVTTGSFATMVGSLMRVVGPITDASLTEGSGTYTIAPFQLALAFDDGRELHFALLPAPGEPTGLQVGESVLARD